MVSMMDNTSDWLTKRQASEVLGISEKGIQRLAAKGGIQSRQLKRPDGVVVTMYHPQDVEQVRRERSPEGGQSFVVPAKKAAPAAARSMVVQDVQAGPNALAVLAESLSSLSAKRLEVRLTERLLLTIGEAVEYAGAGAGYLRRQIAEGKLQLIKGAGPHGADVLRRKDLDKL